MPYHLKERPEGAGYKSKYSAPPLVPARKVQAPRHIKNRNFTELWPNVYTVDLSNNEMRRLEQGFVLDGVAVDNIRSNYFKSYPKKGDPIPPYNAQKDRGCRDFFKYRGTNSLLKKTGARTKAFPKGNSVHGPYGDLFHSYGKGAQYLHLRNLAGAGHHIETVKGHSLDLRDVKPYFGYNGNYGFRRNTPQMRYNPFIMGPTCPFALY